MTSWWVTVIVAVMSGVGATMLRNSYDRGAELRSRMLDAAVDFSTGVIDTLQTARVVSGDMMNPGTGPLVGDDGEWLPHRDEGLRKVNDRLSDLIARRARVDLLFGDESDTGLHATEIVTYVQYLDSAMCERPLSMRGREAAQTYRRYFARTLDAQQDFNRAARTAVRDTLLARCWRWSQRPTTPSRTQR